ncbi:MAG: hypothetical protein E7053_10220 [Lentisphaerae bacterium]|nr:hypothetical protein [Lentisphaerota bacterium]
MLNANAHKNFTSCGDPEAEKLLERVLLELGETLSGSGLCVCLGGSYGRGDGGVRQDKENGLLYNDLDFFVFVRKRSEKAAGLLKEISEKYEKLLSVDVDFSSQMTVKDIQNNASRLMMQELKRGYRLVCGEDLLAQHLPEYPASALPFSEACRLLLNRGMGLMLAGEKIKCKSSDTDFILRNIYKGILGAGDALLIAWDQYCWRISERLAAIENSDLPEMWKKLYCDAVKFKSTPARQIDTDIATLWSGARDFWRASLLRCAGVDDPGKLYRGIYAESRKKGEVSLKNYLKYCIKTRTLVLTGLKKYSIPTVAVLLPEVYSALAVMPETIDSKLHQHWLIFN